MTPEKFFLLSGHLDTICAIIQPSKENQSKGENKMRGYFTAGGYYGLVDGRYLLFSDESEYFDYVREYSEVA